MAVFHHSRSDDEYPLAWRQGLLARPSDFSVVRAPMNSRQRARQRQVLPRGTAAGEESGAFWWAAINDPESQEHRPAKYLERKMAELPRDRITYVTSLIHENNWYMNGNPFNPIYYENRARRRPRTPPFDIDTIPDVPLRPEKDKEKVWQWWEEMVTFIANNKHVRVLSAEEILHLVRQDDLERTYDRETLEAAARQLGDADSFPPRFLVATGDALSLSDAVQAITRALASGASEDSFAVRTMLGPIRTGVPRQPRGSPPPSTKALTVSAAGVRAAAASLAAKLDERGKPDALPATVRIDDQEVEMETYLYAAAKALLGEKGPIRAPALKQAGADPARWTAKPARRIN